MAILTMMILMTNHTSTTAIISASGGIPDIIRTDKIPFGGNNNHEYDLEAYSHHDKIPWSHHDVFDGDDKEIQTVPVYLYFSIILLNSNDLIKVCFTKKIGQFGSIWKGNVFATTIAMTMMIWAQRLIPTMTNYQYGGNLSAMMIVGHVYK